MLRLRTMRLMMFASLFAGALVARAATAGDLQLDVYNPEEKGVFSVASEIISGRHEAILIDAQFRRTDAEALVQKIRASGKSLTAVYISQADPDYYFGLAVIQAAFPAAKIVATPATIAVIKATMQAKLAYWGPILKDQAPQHLIIPEPLHGHTLSLEGHAIEIRGLDGPAPARSYVWIPALKTVAGGVLVDSGIHVWVADTQSRQSRRDWLAALHDIEWLRPARVIPGHYIGPIPDGLAAVRFTADYLRTFERQAALAHDSAELIAAMKTAYPALAEFSSLELSAKVIKGEQSWPTAYAAPAESAQSLTLQR